MQSSILDSLESANGFYLSYYMPDRENTGSKNLKEDYFDLIRYLYCTASSADLYATIKDLIFILGNRGFSNSGNLRLTWLLTALRELVTGA